MLGALHQVESASYEIGARMTHFAGEGADATAKSIGDTRRTFHTYLNPVMDWWLGAGEATAASLAREWKRPSKPAWGIEKTKIGGQEYAVSEETVYESAAYKVIHFKCAGAPSRPPLLIDSAQSGHFATLHRKTVIGFLPDHDVFMVEPKDAREIPLRMDAYRALTVWNERVPLESGRLNLFDMTEHKRNIVNFMVNRFRGRTTLDILAICQAGQPMTRALALRGTEGIGTYAIMAAPMDTDVNPSKAGKDIRRVGLPFMRQILTRMVPHGFNLPGEGRYVHRGKTQLDCFKLPNLLDHLFKGAAYVKNRWLGDPTSREAAKTQDGFDGEFNAVMDLAGESLFHQVDDVFIGNRFARGKGRVKHFDEVADVANITAPVVGIEATEDDVAPPGQTGEFLKHFVNAASVIHHMVKKAGHYGVFSGTEGFFKNARPFLTDVFYANRGLPAPQADAKAHRSIVKLAQRKRAHAFRPVMAAA